MNDMQQQYCVNMLFEQYLW